MLQMATFLKSGTPTTQGYTCAGDSRCTQQITSVGFSAQRGSEFLALLERDALAVVLAAPVDVESIPPTTTVPLPPNREHFRASGGGFSLVYP